MKPESVKLLLKAYAQSRLDGYHGLGNLSVECDNPCGNGNHFTGQMWEEMIPQAAMAYDLPFGQAPVPPGNIIETGKRLADFANDFAAQPEKSIVRFKEIWMVKEPKEQIISIPVLRDASVSDVVIKVYWTTHDKTALGGTHYVVSSGEITFNQGDTSKEIQIPILNFNDDANDLRFTVELNHGMYNPNPITISLTKTEHFYFDEMQVFKNLPSLPFTVPDLKAVLDSCLNSRTFLVALTYLCSTTKDINAQIALACELSLLCAKKSSGGAMREDSIINIFTNFFRRDEYSF